MENMNKKFSELLEKKKFNTSTDPKKLNDEQLMDFIAFLDNIKPDSSNKAQHEKTLKDAMAQMKKRGFI